MELGSAGSKFLTVGGEVRSWYQGFRNANWGVGPQDNNGYLLQRLSVYGDFHVHDRIRAFAQLTSAFDAGQNGGPRPVIDESMLFFEQAFADVAVKAQDENSLVVRLGRQEFLFGSGRLVSPRQGPNVPQAFDGIILQLGTFATAGFVPGAPATIPDTRLKPRVIGLESEWKLVQPAAMTAIRPRRWELSTRFSLQEFILAKAP